LSPRTPPGLYGDSRDFQVFNAGRALPELMALDSIPYAARQETYALAGERNLKPVLLKAALCLLLAEAVLTLFLRGILSLPVMRRGAAGIAVLAVLSFSPAAMAQDAKPEDLVKDVY